MKTTTCIYRSLLLSGIFTLTVLCGSPLYAQFGDNLGRHKADRALDMNAKDLQNVALLKYKTLDVANLATGGFIGAAAATVDLYTAFQVTQTTAGQTLSLPSPTTPIVGQVAYVKNTGTESFTMYSTTVAAGAIIALSYNGSIWAAASSASTAPLSGLTAATATNTIDNTAFNQTWSWNSLASSGTGLSLESNSTAQTGASGKLVDISLQGTNTSAGVITTALNVVNLHTGATSTNVGLRVSASGGTTANYALLVPNGNVGIGTSTPSWALSVVGTGRYIGEFSGIQTATDNSNQLGLMVHPTFSPTASTVNTSGIYIDNIAAPPSGVDITKAMGIYVTPGAAAGTGTVTNGYGLYVDNPGYGTNKYAAYFGGNVGIGTTSPTAGLDVATNGARFSGDAVGSSTSLTGGTYTGFFNTTGYLRLVGNNTGLNGGALIDFNKTTTNPQTSFEGRIFYDLNGQSMSFSTNGGERMRIISNGNVGIGIVPATASKLEVNGGIRISNDNNAGLVIGRADNTYEGGEIALTGAGTYDSWGIDSYKNTLRFATWTENENQVQMTNGGTGSMGLYVEGKVGIGKTLPALPLDVPGGALFGNALYFSPSYGNTLNSGYNENSDNADMWINYTGYQGGASYYRNFYVGNGKQGGAILSCDGASGNVGIGIAVGTTKLYVNGSTWTTTGWSSSDARWKKNITPIGNALDKVMALRGVSYNWNKAAYPDRNFDDKIHLGFIAQEVEKIVPELVMTQPDGYKGLEYNAFPALLVNALQETNTKLESKISKLESENAALKADIEAIKKKLGM